MKRSCNLQVYFKVHLTREKSMFPMSDKGVDNSDLTDFFKFDYVQQSMKINEQNFLENRVLKVFVEAYIFN